MLALALILVVFVLVLLLGLAAMSPEQRMMRERRHHAERTARSMGRMTRIKAQTIRRMDEAEGRRHW